MIIHITQKHIDSGTRTSSDRCPVALALSEATGREWLVTRRWLCHASPLRANGWGTDISTPTLVATKIRDYDRSGVMETFSFELEVAQ
jgi:hypothetical protein